MLRYVMVAALAAGVAACDDDTGAPAPNQSPPDMATIDPVTRGKMYVDARGCPNCHQSTDAADGTMSGTTTPRKGTMAYPANLTPDVDTGIGSWTDDQIVRAFRSGVDDANAPLCPPMPHFDGTGGDGRPIGDDEAAAIVAYLRSLPPVHHEIPESSCPPIK